MIRFGTARNSGAILAQFWRNRRAIRRNSLTLTTHALLRRRRRLQLEGISPPFQSSRPDAPPHAAAPFCSPPPSLVFNSKGGELEEEDIDAIIARGEERTEQDNAKLQDQANSLANFTLNGEERSLYEFGGQDWSGGADGALAINLPKRVEKKNYNEADMAHQRQERAPKMPRHLQVMPLPLPPPPPPLPPPP